MIQAWMLDAHQTISQNPELFMRLMITEPDFQKSFMTKLEAQMPDAYQIISQDLELFMRLMIK